MEVEMRKDIVMNLEWEIIKIGNWVVYYKNNDLISFNHKAKFMIYLNKVKIVQDNYKLIKSYKYPHNFKSNNSIPIY